MVLPFSADLFTAHICFHLMGYDTPITSHDSHDFRHLPLTFVFTLALDPLMMRVMAFMALMTFMVLIYRSHMYLLNGV